MIFHTLPLTPARFAACAHSRDYFTLPLFSVTGYQLTRYFASRRGFRQCAEIYWQAAMTLAFEEMMIYRADATLYNISRGILYIYLPGEGFFRYFGHFSRFLQKAAGPLLFIEAIIARFYRRLFWLWWDCFDCATAYAPFPYFARVEGYRASGRFPDIYTLAAACHDYRKFLSLLKCFISFYILHFARWLFSFRIHYRSHTRK